ncbi:hypothetical protein ACLB0R_12420 [Sphingomonas sp. GlSt437]|uniref:hypothetical protein n=1 Tax=Sphingomonas sp. GlSt437 TaxID=3389970 RepID=UPI003A88DED2
MLQLIIGLLMTHTVVVGPPKLINECKWVRGRFDVWNGSGVRRIWIIGTHRLIALRDDDDNTPSEIQKFVYSGPHPKNEGGLRGDFHVCALEPSLPRHMQHVRLIATRNLSFMGKPFPPVEGHVTPP